MKDKGNKIRLFLRGSKTIGFKWALYHASFSDCLEAACKQLPKHHHIWYASLL